MVVVMVGAPPEVCGRGGRDAVRDLPRYSWSLLARLPDDGGAAAAAAVVVGDARAPSCEVEKRKVLSKGTGPCDVLGRVLIVVVVVVDERTSGRTSCAGW